MSTIMSDLTALLADKCSNKSEKQTVDPFAWKDNCTSWRLEKYILRKVTKMHRGGYT